jgi:hypothetical protein
VTLESQCTREALLLLLLQHQSNPCVAQQALNAQPGVSKLTNAGCTHVKTCMHNGSNNQQHSPKHPRNSTAHCEILLQQAAYCCVLQPPNTSDHLGLLYNIW